MTFTRNQQIAARLREVGELLAAQEAIPYRVAAYRRAADVVARLDEDAGTLLATHGLPALTSLPGIDRGLAGAIAELVRSGRLALLDRLRGTLDAEALFRTVPGIGAKLARQIHEALHVDTLEALETAAWDGRLEAVPGVGERRAQAFRLALATLLGRTRATPPADGEPPVGVLLDVDAEYRRRAAAGELRTIAPRRFNPDERAWLPILHTQRGPWHFTALFSNTERAHRLGRTGDWVVLSVADDGHHDRQYTVVTETHGAAAGHRVVRGRETECARELTDRDYRAPSPPPTTLRRPAEPANRPS